MPSVDGDAKRAWNALNGAVKRATASTDLVSGGMELRRLSPVASRWLSWRVWCHGSGTATLEDGAAVDSKIS